MAEGVNVRFAGELQRFIKSRVVKSGLYNSASEYVRDLVRRDYERVELRKLDPSDSDIESEVQAALAEFDSRETGKTVKESKPRRKASQR